MTKVRQIATEIADREAAERAAVEQEIAAAKRARGEAVHDAAEALGAKLDEIESVDEDDPRGVVVRMVGGSSFVFVPGDKPDANGRTGLMACDIPRRIVDGQWTDVGLATPGARREMVGSLWVYEPR